MHTVNTAPIAGLTALTAATALSFAAPSAQAASFYLIDGFDSEFLVELPFGAATGATDTDTYNTTDASVLATLERIDTNIIFLGAAAGVEVGNTGIFFKSDDTSSRGEATLSYSFNSAKDFSGPGKIVLRMTEVDGDTTVGLSINGGTAATIDLDDAFIASTGLDLNNDKRIAVIDGEDPLYLEFDLALFASDSPGSVNSVDLVLSSNENAVDLEISAFYVVPTPAAAFAGFAALGGLALRRRR